MSLTQNFKTTCNNCGDQVETRVVIFNGDNDINVDFLEGMEFHCNCGSITYLEVEKYTD